MPCPKKEIPFDDVKGLKTLLAEGKTQKEIAIYYDVSQPSVSRRIKELSFIMKACI